MYTDYELQHIEALPYVFIFCVMLRFVNNIVNLYDDSDDDSDDDDDEHGALDC